MESVPPRCMATLIGSLPLTDPQEAVRLVMDHLDEAPLFPELPRHGFLEEMVPAHTDGLPCLREDLASRKVYIDTSKDCSGELAAFYEKALQAESTSDFSAFSLRPAYASTLELTASALGAKATAYPCVKVQSIGPISFQLQLFDEHDRPLYYNDTFHDVLTRQITLQSCWMVRRFAPFAERVIAFLDEPALAAFGSSGYLGVLREDVVDRLGATVAAVKGQGAVVGVHVCGNTDWSMILQAGVDLINYDAYGYGSSMLIYAEQLKPFLEAGGILAWGIVPTSEAVHIETVESLQERLFDLVNQLAARGIDRRLILEQSMLTPTCGMGSVGEQHARRVITILAGLARSTQAKVR